MDTQKLKQTSLAHYPDMRSDLPEDIAYRRDQRNAFELGAMWTLNNYAINWINPIDAPPVFTDKSDDGELQQINYYSSDLFLFTKYGDSYRGYAVSFDNKTLDHWITEDEILWPDDVIAYCPVKAPDWYNKPEE